MSSGDGVEVSGGVVRVSGDVTLANAARVLQAGSRALGGGSGALVFDLAGLRHCDSSALAVLLQWLRQARRQGRALAYRGAPERLRQLARISELDGLLALN